MLQPRIASREATLTNLATALNNLALCSRHAPKRQQPTLVFTRHASHAAQGRANGPKDSAGRRLGAKKTASQYVIPGNIIFKQRGTKWFPGENVGIGKDHTIYSTVYGYVQYYRNPALHPKRRYIGVALEKEGPRSTLPTPPNAPTPRRLGFHTVPRKPDPEPIPDDQLLDAHAVIAKADGSVDKVPVPKQASTDTSKGKSVQMFSLKPFEAGHVTRRGGYGIANWEIGRAAEHKGVNINPFDRTDRWRAWRQRAKRVKAKELAKAAKARNKTKGKKSNKKIVAG